MNCVHCSRITENPRFCSRSCSAKHNNRTTPKRHPEGNCADCGAQIVMSRKYCKTCLLTNHRVDYSKVTLDQLKLETGSRNSYHTMVHQHSKQVAEKAGLLEECRICGYDFYVECCHIRPVSDFPKSSTLEIVNAIDNLIGLCPNHHKELDRGKLKL